MTMQKIVRSNGAMKGVYIVASVICGVVSVYLRTFHGNIHQLSSSPSHYISLLVAVGALLTLSSCAFYLAVSGFGSGVFPGSKTKMPVDTVQHGGIRAIFGRALAFAAGLGLLAFSVSLLLLL